MDKPRIDYDMPVKDDFIPSFMRPPKRIATVQEQRAKSNQVSKRRAKNKAAKVSKRKNH